MGAANWSNLCSSEPIRHGQRGAAQPDSRPSRQQPAPCLCAARHACMRRSRVAGAAVLLSCAAVAGRGSRSTRSWRRAARYGCRHASLSRPRIRCSASAACAAGEGAARRGAALLKQPCPTPLDDDCKFGGQAPTSCLWHATNPGRLQGPGDPAPVPRPHQKGGRNLPPTLRTELVSPADCGRNCASTPAPPSPLMT